MLSTKFRIPKDTILRVIKTGRRSSNNYFDIRSLLKDEENPRFTFVVSVKIDKRATVRNTIKRKFRSAIYEILKNGDLIFKNYDTVFLIRDKNIKNLKSYEIKEIILKTLEKR